MKHETTTTFLNGSTATNSEPLANPVVLPSPEALPKAKRRSFSAAYKRRIVQEAGQCYKAGQIGALLRREGLYSSQLAAWRKQAGAGQLQGTQQTKRGRKPGQSAEQKENARLQRQITRLEQRLVQSQLIIEAQKKIADLFDVINQQQKGQQ